MADITFCPQQPWALPPDKPHVDRAAARAERDAYAANFRHKRIARLPADCPPWVLGQELGWTIRSPITATLTPVRDTDFGVPDEENVTDVARRAQRTQMWMHGRAWIGTAEASWLRLHDYRTPTAGSPCSCPTDQEPSSGGSAGAPASSNSASSWSCHCPHRTRTSRCPSASSRPTPSTRWTAPAA